MLSLGHPDACLRRIPLPVRFVQSRRAAPLPWWSDDYEIQAHKRMDRPPRR